MTHYRIETKSNGDFYVPYNLGTPTRIQRGATSEFQFEFPRFHDNLTYSSDATLSNEVVSAGVITIESGVTVTVESDAILQGTKLNIDGTLNNKGEVNINSDYQNTINEFVEWAGEFYTEENQTSEPIFRSQLPNSTNITSLVWGIQPKQALQEQNIRGAWGLVNRLEPNRNPALTTDTYQVTVQVLGEYSDFTDHTDVENTLQI